MATTDRVNLIEEFKGQENNNFIILTTFSFDPTFFDTFLLDKIRRNNPYAEIFILIDSKTYHSKYDEFTSRTGTDYHLVPVSIKNGFFHPKVHMFLSETDEQATVYVGSANLTLQGMTNNLEAVVKTEHGLEQELPRTIASIIEFFEEISDHFGDDLEYQTVLEDLSNTHFMEYDTEDESNIKFLTNHHTHILDQMSTEIPETKFDELVLIAPFVSRSPDVVEKLAQEFQISKATLLLQRGSHNLEAVDSYRELDADFGIKFNLRELIVDEGRRLHAKLIILKGDPSYILVGSPNLTKAALLSDWDTGNVESGLLLSGSNIDILDEFETCPVTDEDQFLADTSPNLGTGQTDTLPVYTAKFISPTNKLVLKTAKRPGKGEITIKTRNPSEEMTKSIDLSDPEKEISVDKGIPSEVTVRFEDEVGRRRVFHDKDRIFKRAKRTSITLREISESFDDRAEVELTDLVFVFQSLNENQERTTTGKNQTKGNNGGSSSSNSSSHDQFRPPSRGSGSTSGIDSLLRKLTNTYESVQAEKQRRAELEETYTGTEDDEYLSTQRTTVSDVDKVESQLRSLIRKSNRLLLQFSEKSDEPAETWLEGQHLLFRLFVMLVGNIEVSKNLYEWFEEQICENLESLEDINETDIEFTDSVKRRFFTYMLIYNILCRSVNRQDYSPRSRFMRHVYSADELVNRELYETVREEVEANIDPHMENVPFELGQFTDAYAVLITKCLGPKTVRADAIEIGERMINESDEEFKTACAAVLYRIADVYSISRSWKRTLRELDPPEGDISEEVIEHLLQR